MAKRLWLAAAAVVVGAFGAIASGVVAQRSLNSPLAIPAEGLRLEVANGASLRRVTANLAERGILRQPWLLASYGRWTGEATRIRAGEYELSPGTTPVALLAKLVSGEVFLHEITIVEGSRFFDALTAIRAHPAIVAGDLDGPALMTALGAPGVHPEGQLFPDTYRFPKGTTDVELLRIAHDALVTRLDDAWSRRSPNTAIETPYEALVLASIIEKETALASERPLISGVFQQRLRRNMRLQTDPTVIYGLGDSYDGNLRRQDLERDTPYNTYTRFGLPPTPIALVGVAALEAAVAPAPSDALFFVATGRGDGSHRFSATLEEHERAVNDYLRQLRSRGEQ
jgi:UPF0755 protein